MKVPFGNLRAQYDEFRPAVDEAVQRVLDSGYFVLGPELARLESEFKRFSGTDYVAGCNSGTDAIYLALKACGVEPGDEVLTVAHTAVPTISAIRMTGATPVFVDICPFTYTMDVADLERKITPGARAVVPVHLYGQMADMDPIMEIASKHGLKVIEDCAQSVNATYKGRLAGSIGDFGAFSFYPSKNLGAFGDGGAVSTKSKENHEKLVMLRNYGQSQRYYHDIEGMNSRLDELQSAILTAQMPGLDELTARRQNIANRYSNALSEFVGTPRVMDGRTHVYHLYVIETSHRENLMAHLMEASVQPLIHYPVPAHLQKAYRFLGHERGYLPVTERITERIVSLPMFPQLTNEQVELVIEKVAEFYKKNDLRPEPSVSYEESYTNADEKSYEAASQATSAR